MPVRQHKTYDHFNEEMQGCDLYGSPCPAPASVTVVVRREFIIPSLVSAARRFPLSGSTFYHPRRKRRLNFAKKFQKYSQADRRYQGNSGISTAQLRWTGVMLHALVVNLPPPCKTGMAIQKSKPGVAVVLKSPTSFFLASLLSSNINQNHQHYRKQETRFLSLATATDH